MASRAADSDSAASPGHTWIGVTDAGMFLDGLNQSSVGLSTAGVTRMQILPNGDVTLTNPGRLGIGKTAASNYDLDVVGSVHASTFDGDSVEASNINLVDEGPGVTLIQSISNDSSRQPHISFQTVGCNYNWDMRRIPDSSNPTESRLLFRGGPEVLGSAAMLPNVLALSKTDVQAYGNAIVDSNLFIGHMLQVGTSSNQTPAVANLADVTTGQKMAFYTEYGGAGSPYNKGLYEAISGSNNSLSGGNAPAGYNFGSWAQRIRTNDDVKYGIILENSSEARLMSVRGSDGSTRIEGDLSLGGALTTASNVAVSGNFTAQSASTFTSNLTIHAPGVGAGAIPPSGNLQLTRANNVKGYNSVAFQSGVNYTSDGAALFYFDNLPQYTGIYGAGNENSALCLFAGNDPPDSIVVAPTGGIFLDGAAGPLSDTMANAGNKADVNVLGRMRTGAVTWNGSNNYSGGTSTFSVRNVLDDGSGNATFSADTHIMGKLKLQSDSNNPSDYVYMDGDVNDAVFYGVNSNRGFPYPGQERLRIHEETDLVDVHGDLVVGNNLHASNDAVVEGNTLMQGRLRCNSNVIVDTYGTGAGTIAPVGNMHFEHGNVEGYNSITFRSGNNSGSDGAAIYHFDNLPQYASINGASSEHTALCLYAANDGSGGDTDSVIVAPTGPVFVDGLGTGGTVSATMGSPGNAADMYVLGKLQTGSISWNGGSNYSGGTSTFAQRNIIDDGNGNATISGAATLQGHLQCNSNAVITGNIASRQVEVCRHAGGSGDYLILCPYDYSIEFIGSVYLYSTSQYRTDAVRLDVVYSSDGGGHNQKICGMSAHGASGPSGAAYDITSRYGYRLMLLTNGGTRYLAVEITNALRFGCSAHFRGTIQSHGSNLFYVSSGAASNVASAPVNFSFNAFESGETAITDGSFRVYDPSSNANRLFVHSGHPNVGVNTATPQYTLDVNGTIHAASNFIVPTVTASNVEIDADGPWINLQQTGSNGSVHQPHISFQNTGGYYNWSVHRVPDTSNTAQSRLFFSGGNHVNGGTTGLSNVLALSMNDVEIFGNAVIDSNVITRGNMTVHGTTNLKSYVGIDSNVVINTPGMGAGTKGPVGNLHFEHGGVEGYNSISFRSGNNTGSDGSAIFHFDNLPQYGSVHGASSEHTALCLFSGNDAPPTYSGQEDSVVVAPTGPVFVDGLGFNGTLSPTMGSPGNKADMFVLGKLQTGSISWNGGSNYSGGTSSFTQRNVLDDGNGNITAQNSITMGRQLYMTAPSQIWIHGAADSKWGIYLAHDGSNNSLSGGTAVSGYNFSGGISLRNRLYQVSANGFIIENSAENRLFSVRASDGYTRVEGSLSVSGSISKSSGSFNIPHPLPSKTKTHRLVHSFLEGPQADVLYSGMTTLGDHGKASINIDDAFGMTPGTFLALTRNWRRSTTNETGFTSVKSDLQGAVLHIHAANAACRDEIYWQVIGERKDHAIHASDLTDDNGRIVVEPLIS